MSRDPIGDYLGRRARYYDYKAIRAEDKMKEARLKSDLDELYRLWLVEPGRAEVLLKRMTFSPLWVTVAFIVGFTGLMLYISITMWFLILIDILVIVYLAGLAAADYQSRIAYFEQKKRNGDK